MTRNIKPGDRIIARTASNEWKAGVAYSAVESTHWIDPRSGRYGKIHDFPVIWVDLGHGRTPWPVEDVKLQEPQP